MKTLALRILFISKLGNKYSETLNCALISITGINFILTWAALSLCCGSFVHTCRRKLPGQFSEIQEEVQILRETLADSTG